MYDKRVPRGHGAAPEGGRFPDALARALAEKHGTNHPSYQHWLADYLGQVEYFRRRSLPILLRFLDKPWDECVVLDVGCGTGGPSVAFACEGARVVGVEYYIDGLGINLATVRAADHQVSVSFIQGDGCCLPLKDNTADLIFCNQVIEHVPNYHALLMEAHRVLRPSGILYVATGNRSWIIEQHSFLPFANWMPRRAAEFYVRSMRRRNSSNEWDVWPLFSWQVRRELQRFGFRIEASADSFVSERFLSSLLGRLFLVLKRPGFEYLEPFWPHVIFAARKLGVS